MTYHAEVLLAWGKWSECTRCRLLFADESVEKELGFIGFGWGFVLFFLSDIYLF